MQDSIDTAALPGQTAGPTSASNQDTHIPDKKNAYKERLLNRWPRAIARLCDLAWQVVLVMGIFAYAISTGEESRQIHSGLFLLLLFTSIPIALLLDAIIASLLGNTPAKSIIGIKATTSRGERLKLITHLRRNFGVWTDGIALGLAPLSIITMIRQFKRVSGRRQAIYDEKLHVRVRSSSYTTLRAFIAIPIFAAIIFFALASYQ